MNDDYANDFTFFLVFLIAIVLSGCNSFQTVNTENGTGERDMMQDNTTSGYEVNVGRMAYYCPKGQ